MRNLLHTPYLSNENATAHMARLADLKIEYCGVRVG
nr:MAG TPA: hypothetical protein [Caudoviricetes sp.]